MSSPAEQLEELLRWIEGARQTEEDAHNYQGSARALAYGRVLRRLRPIVRQIRRIRKEFDLPPALAAPTFDPEKNVLRWRTLLDDNTCPSCQEENGKTLTTVEELSAHIAACTNPNGCRCVVDMEYE